MVLLMQDPVHRELLLVHIPHVTEKRLVAPHDAPAGCHPQRLGPLGIFAWPGHIPLLVTVHVFSPGQGIVRNLLLHGVTEIRET